MLPCAMLEGMNDLIDTVEDFGHVMVCRHFVFDAPLT
jgi:hypothetical protein